MKTKSFELLKDLHVRYYQGAYDVLDDAIELATQIYCEVNEIERTDSDKFFEQIKEALHDKFPRGADSSEVWRSFKPTLEKFLDNMNYFLTK